MELQVLSDGIDEAVEAERARCLALAERWFTAQSGFPGDLVIEFDDLIDAMQDGLSVAQLEAKLRETR